MKWSACGRNLSVGVAGRKTKFATYSCTHEHCPGPRVGITASAVDVSPKPPEVPSI